MYLVTFNRGRIDLLDSIVARLLRPLIMNRTRASTEHTLDQAKLTMERELQQSRVAWLAGSVPAE